MVNVYGKSNCVQCSATLRWLGSNNVEHNYILVDENPEAYEKVSSMGYQQVPVVISAQGEHWSGFQPERLKALVT